MRVLGSASREFDRSTKPILGHFIVATLQLFGPVDSERIETRYEINREVR